MKRILFWGTIAAGAVAAYMMYRRGEPMGTIAVRAVTNPVGSLLESPPLPLPHGFAPIPEDQVCSVRIAKGSQYAGSKL
jgi:hypothetical protein